MADRNVRRPPRKRDVYIAILVASANGRGLTLTPQECDALTLDDAIQTRATNALTEAEWNEARQSWSNIDPYKARDAWNGNCRDERGRWAV
jgi:hypothetical protein